MDNKDNRREYVETQHFKIYTTTREEMESIIEDEMDEELKKAYQEMLQGCIDHPDQWVWYAIWMIVNREGKRIGDLCFKGTNDAGMVEIGYGINEEYRGQGFATEAVDAMVNWASMQPGVKVVEAETDPDNLASQQVLKKCGFVPTGVMGEEGPRFMKGKL